MSRKCPDCGSEDIETKTEKDGSFLGFLSLGLLDGNHLAYYHCMNCGYTFGGK